MKFYHIPMAAFASVPKRFGPAGLHEAEPDLWVALDN